MDSRCSNPHALLVRWMSLGGRRITQFDENSATATHAETRQSVESHGPCAIAVQENPLDVDLKYQEQVV